MIRAPLRVGLLVDTLDLPAWTRKIIAEIQASESARVVLVVRKRQPGRRLAGWKRLWRNRNRLAYIAYRRLDAALVRKAADAFAVADTRPLLAGCEMLDVTVRETKHCDHLDPNDVDAIRALELDVLLRFGFRILRGPVLQAARYGVWSYHHGDNHVNRGGPAGFWEVMLDYPTTGSVLQVLNEDLDNGQVICRSYAKTDRGSVWRSRNNYYWKSSGFVARKLRDLFENGPEALGACQGTCASVDVYSKPLFRKPGNLETMALVTTHVARRAREHVRRMHQVDQWALAYQLSPEAPMRATTLFRFKEVRPPLGMSWADPFPVETENGYQVFLEEFDLARRCGHISVGRITPDGKFEQPERVLERPYHLSYPFVFEWRGKWFMMPETSNAARIEVFSARGFPFDWTPEAVLFDALHAVDSTLLMLDGTWWLFTNISGHPEARNYDELYAFHAPTPFGPWTPHRRNPVKSDVRSSRGAGRFFWNGSTLFRPAQDCSARYGSATVLNRIDKLTPDEFRETEVARIEPRWRPGLSGTHTFNSCQGLTMVDFRHARSKYFG
jgi:hypothetical protein